MKSDKHLITNIEILELKIANAKYKQERNNIHKF